MATKELVPATETAVVADFRPIYAWPPLEAEEWKAAKKAFPDVAEPAPERIKALGPSPASGAGRRSMLLIPCSVLPELGEDGTAILQWEDDLAEVLGRRQLRYGKQAMSRGNLPSHFLGFSGRLSLSEVRVCFENKLYQREDNQNRLPSQAIANEDGSQTFEYRDHLNRGGEFRLERLHELVMGTIAPQLGRLMASNVEVQLAPEVEQPSLFSEESRV